MDFKTLSSQYQLLRAIPNEFWDNQDPYQKGMIKKNYRKDEVIHFDGDVCSNLEIIISGQVIIERIDESGNFLKITEFCSNDMLGGNLVFSKNPYYPMTVTAKTNVELLLLPKSLVLDFCSSSIDFLTTFLEDISDHSILLGDKIKHYVNRSIRESLTAFLKNEYYLQNTTKIQLHSSKKELADRIGVQRTSLSRELQKMKKEGLVDYDKETITILNVNKF